jgi:L-lactate dehydrogenase complex protein LldG
MQAKENILKKIRAALSEPAPIPFVQSEGNSLLFQQPHDDLGVIFAEEFAKLQGKFIYCETEAELAALLMQWVTQTGAKKITCRETALRQMLEQHGFTAGFHPDLADTDAAITGCEYLVARTGSLVLGSRNESGRTTSVYCPVHLCIAYTSQLVYDTRDALQALKEKYGPNLPSGITFASGPSRTADIEKTLVKGIHGPKDVYCFLVEKK